MTEQKEWNTRTFSKGESEKITPIKNAEEVERLKTKYEEADQANQARILELENKVTQKCDEIFELQQANKRLAEERDDWKKEAHQNRKTYQAEKASKQEADFLTELAKLQAKKGININA